MPVAPSEIKDELQELEQMYVDKARNTKICWDLSKVTALLGGISGVGVSGALVGGTIPLWAVCGGIYGVVCLAQYATSKRTNVIPFTHTTLNGILSGAAFSHAKSRGDVEADAQLDQQVPYWYQYLGSLENKVSYLLAGEWQSVCLPYLELFDTAEDVEREFLRIVDWVSSLPNVVNYVENTELIERHSHGRYGTGKGAFVLWCREEITRRYATRRGVTVPPDFGDAAELQAATRIEVEVEDYQDALPAAEDDEPVEVLIPTTLVDVYEPEPETGHTPLTDLQVRHALDEILEETNNPQVNLAESLGLDPQTAIIVGMPRSGKGFSVAWAIRVLKEHNPDLKVYFVDPKAHPSECYLDGVADDVYAVRLPTPSEAREGARAKAEAKENGDKVSEVFDPVQGWIDGLWRFIQRNNIETDTNVLLIVDELAAVKKRLPPKEFNHLTTLTHDIATLGPVNHSYVWLMTQSPNLADLGLTGGAVSVYRRIAIVKARGSQSDTSLLKSKATGFFGVCQSQDVVADRMHWDSNTAEWTASASLGPLDKPEIPTLPSEVTTPQVTLTPELRAVADKICGLLKPGDSEQKGRLRQRCRSFGRLSEDDQEKILKALESEGTIELDAHLITVVDF